MDTDSLPKWDATQSLGKFNIIAMVTDHVPQRIVELQQDIDQLDDKRRQLYTEQEQLISIMNALKKFNE